MWAALELTTFVWKLNALKSQKKCHGHHVNLNMWFHTILCGLPLKWISLIWPKWQSVIPHLCRDPLFSLKLNFGWGGKGSGSWNFLWKIKIVFATVRGPGTDAHAPRAGTSYSACRSWRYRCSMMSNRGSNLSMCDTFLIRLLPPPNNCRQQLRQACLLVVYSSFWDFQPMD